MNSVAPAFRLSSPSVAQVMRVVRPIRGGVRLAEIPASPADAIAEQVRLAGSTHLNVRSVSLAFVTSGQHHAISGLQQNEGGRFANPGPRAGDDCDLSFGDHNANSLSAWSKADDQEREHSS